MLPITVQWNVSQIADVPVFGRDTRPSNFSQDSTEVAILREIGRTNQKVRDLNSAVYTYPQIKGTASEKSDSDIWKWIGFNISGKAGSNSQGSWGDNQYAVMPKIQANRDSITRLDTKNAQQDESITATKNQLNEVNSRLSKQITELGVSTTGNKIGTGLLTGLGISMPILLIGGLAAFLLLRK